MYTTITFIKDDEIQQDNINTQDAKVLAQAISQWIDNGWTIMGIEFDEQIQLKPLR